MNRIALAMVVLCVAGSVSAEPPPLLDNEYEVRPYANGSGPSAIFRLGRIESLKADIFGIIDPIQWRIQYYRLKDWSTDLGAASFRERFHPVGSCRLSPSFRIWRVHEFPNRIVLQSQPFIPKALFIHGPGASLPKLSFSKVTLDATPAALAAIDGASPTPPDAVPAQNCASSSAIEDFASGDTAAIVTGGQNKPFTINRTQAAVGRSFDAVPLYASYKGRFLSSAQELEGASSVNSGDPLRHILLTTRTNVPGFVSTQSVLVRRSNSGKLDRTMVINLGLGRVKLGQRPIAVSSVGEVLVLAAADKSGFRVRQCTFLPQAGATSWCAIDGTPPGDATPGDGGAGVSPPATGDSANTPMWTGAFGYTNREFAVNLAGMPQSCVDLVNPCPVGGVGWVPLPELRGGGQTVAIRRGFPYGQISDRPALAASAINPNLGMSAESKTVNAFAIVGSKPVVFGDIFNNGMVDPDVATVFGIDCSGLVSVLWNMGAKFDTGDFIDFANGRTNSVDRVEAMSKTSIGDAFVINIAASVSGADPVRFINHIALFRESLAAGPDDKSMAILVVESNASCGGACWSFYDESFFSGWAIIRRGKPGKHPMITMRIPNTVAEWRAVFAPVGAN